MKRYKGVTASLRHRVILKHFKKSLRLKKLSYNHKYEAGRDNKGHISVKHRGGRHKRIYREVDFSRDVSKYSLLYNLIKEYDPNRRTNLSRVYTNNFKMFYISNSGRGKVLINKYTNMDRVYISNDNYKLKNIAIGKRVFNIQPINFIKSAGTYGTIVSKNKDYVFIKLPSKLIIKLDNNYTGCIGRNDNVNYNLVNLGKAGARRWLGFRPTVKGNVMNAVDHPHGGNTKGGNASPKTKWGKKAKWVKTR